MLMLINFQIKDKIIEVLGNLLGFAFTILLSYIAYTHMLYLVLKLEEFIFWKDYPSFRGYLKNPVYIQMLLIFTTILPSYMYCWVDYRFDANSSEDCTLRDKWIFVWFTVIFGFSWRYLYTPTLGTGWFHFANLGHVLAIFFIINFFYIRYFLRLTQTEGAFKFNRIFWAHFIGIFILAFAKRNAIVWGVYGWYLYLGLMTTIFIVFSIKKIKIWYEKYDVTVEKAPESFKDMKSSVSRESLLYDVGAKEKKGFLFRQVILPGSLLFLGSLLIYHYFTIIQILIFKELPQTFPQLQQLWYWEYFTYVIFIIAAILPSYLYVWVEYSFENSFGSDKEMKYTWVFLWGSVFFTLDYMYLQGPHSPDELYACKFGLAVLFILIFNFFYTLFIRYISKESSFWRSEILLTYGIHLGFFLIIRLLYLYWWAGPLIWYIYIFYVSTMFLMFLIRKSKRWYINYPV